MEYPRVLTIQDISCFGQCSLTVALPIISACGIETSIIPSAVLSTHTGGFTGFTVRDLSDDIPGIARHWEDEGISFDALYTGYLGSTEQVDYVLDILDSLMRPGAKAIIDPAMADNGQLYPAFDDRYVAAMRRLVARADYVLPNITEACFLTGIPYETEYDAAYVIQLMSEAKSELGRRTLHNREGKTGVAILEDGEYAYYEHRRISEGCHGTGDVYASAFVGMMMNGKSAYESAQIAADYVVRCIEFTQGDPDHWYGVKFELGIPELVSKLA